MATSPRDVKVKIGIEADASQLDELTEGMLDLGAAGKAVTPEMAKIAVELEQAAAATKEFRVAESALETEVKAARQALVDQREALARTRLTTSDADKATDSYKASVKAAQLAILDSRAALRTQVEALDKAATSSRVAAAAEKNLADQLQRTGAAAVTAGRQQSEATRSLSNDLQGIGTQLRSIQAAAGAVLGGQLLGGLIGDVAKTADAYANLAARIKLVTGEGAAFESTFQQVFDIAQRTGSAVSTVGDLFTKLSTAGKQLGVTNAQTLALVETITQATQLSGVSADSANAALIQLAQGLSSGVLRGEELNSILEQTPRLAKALADGLGVTTGELRKLGEAGALTSAQVIGALQGQGAALRAEFDQLPQTIGRAVTNLSTAWTQYIGELDRATGASATIASAINSLARNLDTVATVLFGVGKAVAAFQALKLAQTMLGIGTAATTAAAGLTAYTAAQTAANAATGGTVANVGRFAAALASIKVFALVAVVTSLEALGTAIGVGIAKLQGYGKAIADVEGRMRAQEFAARSLAEGNAALAQSAQIAADRALRLGIEAQALVGTFEKARQAGDTVADSLDKVAKALDLSNVSGIEAAGAALDALAVRSKISGAQVRDSLAAALQTADLGKFRTEATAAFDASEIGARRLAAAIDAMGNESLRRAGLSAQELQTGFGSATASAINDVDALVATLDRLGAKGPETAAALAKALDNAVGAAKTERALQAVIGRYEELGKAGRLSGEQVAAGLDAARAKIDGLIPGVTSLDEALRNFGLKSNAELQETARKFEESWQAIKNSTVVALEDKVKAFEQYEAAAIAANKGVEGSEISLQREILRTQLAVAAKSSSPSSSSNSGTGSASSKGSTSTTRSSGRGPDDGYKPNVHLIDHNEGRTKSVTGNTRDERLAGQNAVDATLQFELRDKLRAGLLTEEDIPDIQAVIASLKQQNELNGSASKLSAGFQSTEGIRDAQQWQSIRGQLEDFIKKAAAPPAAQGGGNSRTVNVNISGRQRSINVASDADQNSLVSLLRELENASSTAG